MIEELDSSGNVLERYIQGLGIDETLADVRSGVTSYYEADGLGSTTSLTDTLGGVVATYEYDSFGNAVRGTEGGRASTTTRYTGRQFDPETGLYYYRTRYYDPIVGRFLSEDSIRFEGGINFYQYVLGNPVNYRDPTGHDAGAIAIGGGLLDLGELGGAAAGAATGAAVVGSGAIGWGVGRGVGHIPVGGGSTVDDAVQAGWLSLILLAERTIPKPARPRCGCTCTCRADADDTMPGNIRPGLPRFAFGTASAGNCSEASTQAKRLATINLGMKPKHIPCKCEGN